MEYSIESGLSSQSIADKFDQQWPSKFADAVTTGLLRQFSCVLKESNDNIHKCLGLLKPNVAMPSVTHALAAVDMPSVTQTLAAINKTIQVPDASAWLDWSQKEYQSALQKALHDWVDCDIRLKTQHAPAHDLPTPDEEKEFQNFLQNLADFISTLEAEWKRGEDWTELKQYAYDQARRIFASAPAAPSQTAFLREQALYRYLMAEIKQRTSVKEKTTKCLKNTDTVAGSVKKAKGGRPKATKYVVTQAKVAEWSGLSIVTVARYDRAFEKGEPMDEFDNYPGRGNEAAICKWCIKHKAHIAEKARKRCKAIFDATRPGADKEAECIDAITRKRNGDIEIDPEAGMSVHKRPDGPII